jgi:hypothetical protein
MISHIVAAKAAPSSTARTKLKRAALNASGAESDTDRSTWNGMDAWTSGKVNSTVRSASSTARV